jgi:hypothetical protein
VLINASQIANPDSSIVWSRLKSKFSDFTQHIFFLTCKSSFDCYVGPPNNKLEVSTYFQTFLAISVPLFFLHLHVPILI